MALTRFQIAPNVEFRLDVEVEGIMPDSSDYSIQQHKKEVYDEFERRLKAAFPEGVTIHTFEFGLYPERGD